MSILTDILGLIPKRAAPVALSKIQSTDQVLDYASAGYFASMQRGWSSAADAYKAVYTRANDRQDAAQMSLPVAAEDVAALKGADKVADAARAKEGQVPAGPAGVSPAVAAQQAAPKSNFMSTTTDFLGGPFWWIMPAGVAAYLIWERKTKSGRRYAKKHGGTKVVLLTKAFGGKKRARRRRR